LDPNDVLVPTKYNGKIGDSSDIALIGISKKNREVLINFFKQ